MKKNPWKALVWVGVTAGVQTLYGWWNLFPEPTHTVGRLEMPETRWDSSATYVYTYRYIIIFSYADTNPCKIFNWVGTCIWFDTLMEDEYVEVTCPDTGGYRVSAKKGISVMSGSPFQITGTGCWYAVDERGRPLSTKLLSVGPGIREDSTQERCVVIFAYQDSTHVVFSDIQRDLIIWEGDLDSAEYYRWNTDGIKTLVFSVEASHPVSAMTGAFSVSMYAPSFNGTFSGKDFLTYAHYEDLKQDLEIIPWEDSTNVTIINLDDPTDTIWQVFCEKKGWIKGRWINAYGGGPRAIYIHSDKDISVSQTPWASYAPSINNPYTYAYYVVRGIDQGGLGLGKEFYLPLEISDSYFSGTRPVYIYSRLQVIAFNDNTQAIVTQIPRQGGTETELWEGVLDKGEYYQYTTSFRDSSGHAIYHVVASDTVATMGSCGPRYGSAFFPMLFWESEIGVAEEPVAQFEEEWYPLTSIGPQIVLHYANHPKGFHAQIFDATGRKVDEVHAADASGTIHWGEGHRTGVYFICGGYNQSPLVSKVVLIR